MAEKLPNPLTCNGCDRPLPGSNGLAAWKMGHLKCSDCVRREAGLPAESRQDRLNEAKG